MQRDPLHKTNSWSSAERVEVLQVLLYNEAASSWLGNWTWLKGNSTKLHVQCFKTVQRTHRPSKPEIRMNDAYIVLRLTYNGICKSDHEIWARNGVQTGAFHSTTSSFAHLIRSFMDHKNSRNRWTLQQDAKTFYLSSPSYPFKTLHMKLLNWQRIKIILPLRDKWAI